MPLHKTLEFWYFHSMLVLDVRQANPVSHEVCLMKKILARLCQDTDYKSTSGVLSLLGLECIVVSFLNHFESLNYRDFE